MELLLINNNNMIYQHKRAQQLVLFVHPLLRVLLNQHHQQQRDPAVYAVRIQSPKERFQHKKPMRNIFLDLRIHLKIAFIVYQAPNQHKDDINSNINNSNMMKKQSTTTRFHGRMIQQEMIYWIP